MVEASEGEDRDILAWRVPRVYIEYMTKPHVLTARVDSETLDRLDQLADRLDRSRAWLINKAVSRFVEEESAFLAFVQEGKDAMDRGDYITHEELIEKLQARKARLNLNR